MNWVEQRHQMKSIILKEWDTLLSQKLSEHAYHQFLKKHSGLFVGNDYCHLIISKLKLGSELETDFVTVADGLSNGNIFELIEIKQPSASLFTKNGTMTSEFSKAVQQIRDWKRWLIDNRSWVKNFLPTNSTRVVTNTNLKFKIIIGRRLENPHEIEKRNQIAEEIGAEIRSFDFLSDQLKRRELIGVACIHDDVWDLKLELSNPFHSAISDSQWKEFCKGRRVIGSHFYNHYYSDVLKIRKNYSKSYQDLLI